MPFFSRLCWYHEAYATPLLNDCLLLKQIFVQNSPLKQGVLRLMTQNLSICKVFSSVWQHPFGAVSHVIAGALSPLVSIVALPIFCAMASYHWVKLSYLSWGHLSSEKYGRIRGQDYTRWDGKSVTILDKEQLEVEQMHAEIGEPLHGRDDFNFIDILRRNCPPIDYPFKTEKDLNWINREVCRREAKDWLEMDLKMLRAFSKALIPFFGVIWVLQSEVLAFKGACFIGCRVCAIGSNSEVEDKHWSWDQALDFHRKLLSISLHKSPPENNHSLQLGATTFV